MLLGLFYLGTQVVKVGFLICEQSKWCNVVEYTYGYLLHFCNTIGSLSRVSKSVYPAVTLTFTTQWIETLKRIRHGTV